MSTQTDPIIAPTASRPPAEPGKRPPQPLELVERSADVGGTRTLLLEASPPSQAPPPIVYLHGNPVGSWIWRPFLERTGGIAPDLPGFGRSAKQGGFDYSLPGYAEYLEAFADQLGLERLTLVAHDIGAIVGLAFAQRVPDRIERLVIANHAPLLPGYRWHRFARIWRTPLVGEAFMAMLTGFAFKRSLRPSNLNGVPDEFLDRAWSEFDRASRRAVLRLYRSMPEAEMVAAGRDLGRIGSPALVVWSTDDPYLGAEFGPAYARALGGDVELEVYERAGHWLWLDRPEVVDRVTAFIAR